MDARRLILTPFIAGAVLAAAIFGVQAQVASAEVLAAQVSPYLRAAIKAEAQARGYNYAGDFKFDRMYAGPGTWVSSVQSVGPDGAIVTYGKYASDEVVSTKFVRKGEYGWVNAESGVGSPERVPAMAAQPGTKARTWVVEGINFPPDSEIALFDGSALGGEMRAPTDHVLVKAKTDASGYFKVAVEFGDYPAQPGQVNRLIQAGDLAFLQVKFDQAGAAPSPTPIDPAPGAPVEPTRPSPSDPSPEDPADSDGDDGNNALAYAAVAGIGLLGLAGGFGIVTLARKR